MSSNESNFNLFQSQTPLPTDIFPPTGADSSASLKLRPEAVPQDLEAIQQHWERRGRKYGISPSASWVDETMLHHEGQILAKQLKTDDRVLDAGCANGYTTIQLARRKRIRITGIDYAPSMVENASLSLSRAGIMDSTVTFRVGNFLNLNFASNTFDKVITKRCMINLGSHEHQRTALLEAWRVLKPGGLFLISEVSEQCSDNLNHLRERFGLETMTPLWHNCYIDETDLLEFAEPYFQVKKVQRFSSSYYMLTWVLYPFFVRSGQRNYAGWFHRLSAHVPQIGDWGLQKLFILQKRLD